MNILYVPGYRYPVSLDEPLTSGDLRYSFNLSRALARMGHQVSIVSRGHEGDPEFHVLDGVKIFRYRSELSRVFSTSFDISMNRFRLFSDLAKKSDLIVCNSPLTLELFLKKHKPDLYICSGLEDKKNYGLSLSEIAGKIGLRLLRDPLKMATWKRSRIVNTTAEKEQKTLEFLKVPTEKIRTIGPGVEVQRYYPQPQKTVLQLREANHDLVNSNSKIVLSVARFTPAKGLLETIRGFEQLCLTEADVLLFIVGVQHSHSRTYRRVVVDTVASSEFKDRIRIFENVAEYKLPIFYSAARVCSVFSVGYDPLPTVIVESMSCGTPVVATDFETRKQLIQNRVNGYLIKEGDVDAWVETVRILLRDDTLHKNLSEAGLKRVKSDFDMDSICKKHLNNLVIDE